MVQSKKKNILSEMFFRMRFFEGIKRYLMGIRCELDG